VKNFNGSTGVHDPQQNFSKMGPRVDAASVPHLGLWAELLGAFVSGFLAESGKTSLANSSTNAEAYVTSAGRNRDDIM
jgi:hypothetical protein